VPNPPSSVAVASRLTYLDGLRGWMALFVVFAHLFRSWLLEPRELASHGADWPLFWLKWTPVGVVTDGVQAVYVFFVISGIALTYPILRSQRPDRTLVAMAVYRYPRLTVPILASCLAVFALLAFGLFHHQAVAERHHTDTSWWRELYSVPPDFGTMLRFALWDVYTPGLPNRQSWNVVLWTMPIELIGSFIIFFLLAAVRWRGLRIAFAAYLSIRDVGTGIYGYFVGFLVGYLLAELVLAAERHPELARRLAAATPLGWLFLAAALACSIRLQVVSFDSSRAEYMMAMNIIAALTVTGVVLTPTIQAWLSRPLSHFLGRISFGLYLTHLPLICAFSSALYLVLIDAVPYGLLVAAVAIPSVVLALAVAWGFSVVVEETLLPRIKRPIMGAAYRAYDLVYRSVRSSVLRIFP
jgi:peptidoglycan/LPS O-acetylase OafA/YrhL